MKIKITLPRLPAHKDKEKWQKIMREENYLCKKGRQQV
jgi:hypothetical protein